MRIGVLSFDFSRGFTAIPKEQALQVAINEICKFLADNDMLVYIVVFDKDGFRVSKKLVRDIAEYIDEHYVETHYSENRSRGLSRLFKTAGDLSNANRIFEFS